MRTKWKETIGTTINGFVIKDIKRENNYTYAFAECPYCHKDSWIRVDGIKDKTVKSCGCQKKGIDWNKSIGKVINGFTIKDCKRENNHTFVYVECPRCKKDKWIRSDGIKTAISCGCYNADNNYIKAVDITGMRYKYLKAIRPTDKRDKDGRMLWECKCECGNTVYLDENRFGHVASCGCKLKEMQSEICKKLYAEGRNKINEYVIDNTDVRTITRNKLLSTNTSGYTGVIWDNVRSRWIAQIEFQKKRYYLGRYEDKKLAIEARKAAEEHLYGDFLKWYAETYPDKWEKLNKSQ